MVISASYAGRKNRRGILQVLGSLIGMSPYLSLDSDTIQHQLVDTPTGPPKR